MRVVVQENHLLSMEDMIMATSMSNTSSLSSLFADLDNISSTEEFSSEMMAEYITLLNRTEDFTEIPDNRMSERDTFFWSCLYIPLVILSNLANFIVIWIILSQKSMRKVTNYFIVNLSVSDIILTTFNVPSGFYYMTQGNWPFGDVYCKFWNFIAVASMSTSVFTLTGIAFDRYVFIIYLLLFAFGVNVLRQMLSLVFMFTLIMFCRIRSE